LRNKPIYILTENLNFFYKLNKRLIDNKIRFKILNNKIPNLDSIILTTSEDFKKIEVMSDFSKFLIFSEDEDFDSYFLKVLAAFRIKYKEIYSNLTFSIDPGKTIGLMIFLDDYYLNSFCCFKPDDLFNTIKLYFHTFHKNDSHLLYLTTKFGRGILSLTYKLVEGIFTLFQNSCFLRVLLIDEFGSSRIKFIQNDTKKLSKDEISALLLSFRNGIEVNENNYIDIFSQIKKKKIREKKYQINEESLHSLKEISERVLKGEISLSESIDLLKMNQ
jgi:hypothetical protein